MDLQTGRAGVLCRPWKENDEKRWEENDTGRVFSSDDLTSLFKSREGQQENDGGCLPESHQTDNDREEFRPCDDGVFGIYRIFLDRNGR